MKVLEFKQESRSDADCICEVSVGAHWVAVDITEALTLGRAPLRCAGCGQPVVAHSASKNGHRAHFEHRIKNENCPTKGSQALPADKKVA